MSTAAAAITSNEASSCLPVKELVAVKRKQQQQRWVDIVDEE
jgi:hypothetical protein